MNAHVITYLTHCRGHVYIKLITHRISHSDWLMVDHELGLAIDRELNG